MDKMTVLLIVFVVVYILSDENARKIVTRKFYEIFICAAGWHKYTVLEDYGYGNRKIWCPVCKQAWAMCDNIKALVPWDEEFEKIIKEKIKGENCNDD
jgi:hypothetical protein